MTTGVEVSSRPWKFDFSRPYCRKSSTPLLKKPSGKGIRPTKEFHELADPIYEKFTLDDREAEFKKLYQYLFGIWGFPTSSVTPSTNFPTLKARWESSWSRNCAEGGSGGRRRFAKWGSVEHDLAKQFEEKGLKGVGIKLIPRRFYDPALTRYCRHELMHINDMLDPAFGYDPDTRVGQNPGEETLILHRYRILSGISVSIAA